MLNLNLEWFQLWFDVCTLHISQKLMKLSFSHTEKVLIFTSVSRWLQRPLVAKLYNIGDCSQVLEIEEDVNFHFCKNYKSLKSPHMSQSAFFLNRAHCARARPLSISKYSGLDRVKMIEKWNMHRFKLFLLSSGEILGSW